MPGAMRFSAGVKLPHPQFELLLFAKKIAFTGKYQLLVGPAVL
jgi:hypothetical protein